MMENDGFDGEDDSGELLAADASIGAEYQASCGNCEAVCLASELTVDDCCPNCGSDDLAFEAIDAVDLFHPGPGSGWSS